MNQTVHLQFHNLAGKVKSYFQRKLKTAAELYGGKAWISLFF
jgi:hypothetical protein